MSTVDEPGPADGPTPDEPGPLDEPGPDEPRPVDGPGPADESAQRIDEPGATAAPGQPARRRRRRATGGTPAPAAEPGTLLPGRSSDDTDTGWGERPPADDDERFLRDVPPHW